MGAAFEALKGRARKRTALVLLTALGTLATPLIGAGAAQAQSTTTKPYGIKPPPPPSRYDVVTQVATANYVRWAHRLPTLDSGVVKKLAFYTPDQQALQTYRIITQRRIKLVLPLLAGSHKHKKPRHKVEWVVWDQIAIPGRPNGQTGWVQSSWLGSVMTSHTLIVVSTEKELMSVYRNGKLIFTAPVGTGDLANKTTTPRGHFWIAEEFPSSDPFYGPWAFGTTDYATDTEFPDGSIVGIHGTNEPWLIPGDPSHGCVRMKDPDILKLKRLVGIGTAVWIQ
jgi:lipoprotein-anchoring transpeptidase ErfK/SrfK